MVSIHERPEPALTRQLFGDWEGDLIKGEDNASAIGTLVERKVPFAGGRLRSGWWICLDSSLIPVRLNIDTRPMPGSG